MKNIDVIHAFLSNNAAHTRNLMSTTDGKLTNYTTTIAIKQGDTITISTKKYSSTTSTIQNTLRREAEAQSLEIQNIYEFLN